MLTFRHIRLSDMQPVTKRRLKEFYEEEARRLSHQEMMYLKGKKHDLWWHRKRLYYILSFLSEIFEKNQITTFVDVGCAEGFYVRHIASAYGGAFCIGADVSRTYIRKARAKEKSLNVAYIVCDVEGLPFRDDSIDVLLCSEVLEHVYNYRGSLAELFRVGKCLVLSFPGHSYLYQAVRRIKPIKRLVDNLLSDTGHISEVRVSDIQEFLKGNYMSFKIKIGGALPLPLFKILPSVRLVDVIDSVLCKVFECFGAIDPVTIHVIKIVKGQS